MTGAVRARGGEAGTVYQVYSTFSNDIRHFRLLRMERHDPFASIVVCFVFPVIFVLCSHLCLSLLKQAENSHMKHWQEVGSPLRVNEKKTEHM